MLLHQLRLRFAHFAASAQRLKRVPHPHPDTDGAESGAFQQSGSLDIRDILVNHIGRDTGRRTLFRDSRSFSGLPPTSTSTAPTTHHTHHQAYSSSETARNTATTPMKRAPATGGLQLRDFLSLAQCQRCHHTQLTLITTSKPQQLSPSFA